MPRFIKDFVGDHAISYYKFLIVQNFRIQLHLALSMNQAIHVDQGYWNAMSLINVTYVLYFKNICSDGIHSSA